MTLIELIRRRDEIAFEMVEARGRTLYKLASELEMIEQEIETKEKTKQDTKEIQNG